MITQNVKMLCSGRPSIIRQNDFLLKNGNRKHTKKENNLKKQLPEQFDVQQLRKNLVNLQNDVQTNCNQKTNAQLLFENQNLVGYKLSLQTKKEDCFDKQGLDKILKLIERFYQYGYKKLLNQCFSNALSKEEKNQLNQKFSAFNFEIDHKFNEGEGNFQERIYKFQEENEISPELEMLIYTQSILKSMKEEAINHGYNFKVDCNNQLCCLPVLNNNNFDFVELQKFFVFNVVKKINSQKILKVPTMTNREANIKYHLLNKLMQDEPQKFQRFKGTLVLISQKD